MEQFSRMGGRGGSGTTGDGYACLWRRPPKLAQHHLPCSFTRNFISLLVLLIMGSTREGENCWLEGTPVGSEFLAKVKSFTPSSRHMAALSGPSVCPFLCLSPTPPRPRPPFSPPTHQLALSIVPLAPPLCPTGWQRTRALPPCSSNWWHCSHAAPPPLPPPPPPRTYAHSCPVAHAQCEHLLAAGATHT